MSTLRVTQNDKVAAVVLDHGRTNVARERALLHLVAVLGRDVNALVETRAHKVKIERRWCHKYLYTIYENRVNKQRFLISKRCVLFTSRVVVDLGCIEQLDELLVVGLEIVHLPVAAHKKFPLTHFRNA